MLNFFLNTNDSDICYLLNFFGMICFNLPTNTLSWVFVVEFVLQELNHKKKNQVYIRIA